MRHKLYANFANRYDLHTPPDQHKHNNRFVIAECLAFSPQPRLLDVGCGTGVLVHEALAAGIDAFGIDPAAAMVANAAMKGAPWRFREGGTEAIDPEEQFDCVTSLGWALNYSGSVDDFQGALRRIRAVLKPGGKFIAELPNARAAIGAVVEERKPGPGGVPDDVLFLFRLSPLDGEWLGLSAQYVYACKSLGELLCEEHVLAVADPSRVSALVSSCGFTRVELYDSWRKDAFAHSVSPFLVATKAAG